MGFEGKPRGKQPFLGGPTFKKDPSIRCARLQKPTRLLMDSIFARRLPSRSSISSRVASEEFPPSSCKPSWEGPAPQTRDVKCLRLESGPVIRQSILKLDMYKHIPSHHITSNDIIPYHIMSKSITALHITAWHSTAIAHHVTAHRKIISHREHTKSYHSVSRVSGTETGFITSYGQRSMALSRHAFAAHTWHVRNRSLSSFQ